MQENFDHAHHEHGAGASLGFASRRWSASGRKPGEGGMSVALPVTQACDNALGRSEREYLTTSVKLCTSEIPKTDKTNKGRRTAYLK